MQKIDYSALIYRNEISALIDKNCLTLMIPITVDKYTTETSIELVFSKSLKTLAFDSRSGNVYTGPFVVYVFFKDGTRGSIIIAWDIAGASVIHTENCLLIKEEEKRSLYTENAKFNAQKTMSSNSVSYTNTVEYSVQK